MYKNVIVMDQKESFSKPEENLLKKVKELVEDAKARKISVVDQHGKELLSFPVTKEWSAPYWLQYRSH